MKSVVKYLISLSALLAVLLSAVLYPISTTRAQIGFPTLPGFGSSGGDPLQQRRSEDQQQCEEEQQNGLGTLGSALQNPHALSNIISKGLTESLPDTIGKIFTEKVPKMIQAQLEARLPSLIQDGLSQQLPALIQGRVGDLVAQGGTDVSIRAALPGIIAELLQQLIPQIISRGLPDVLQQGLEGQLPAEITVRLQAQLPDILSHSTFPADIRQMVIAQTTGLPSPVNVSDSDRQEAANEISAGVTQVAQQSIAESNATQELARQMAQLLTERLLPIINAQLVPHISQSVGNFTNNDQTIGGLINRIPGAGGNFIQSLNIDNGILQPMSQEIGRSLAGSVGTSIREFQINNVLEDAPFLSDGELTQELGSIRGVNAYVDGAGNFAGYSYLGDTFGQDAGNAVNAASGQIAGGAAGGFNFGNLGTSLTNSLKSGLAGGLSGGLAGLVGNIPYAGPLLAPIVQQVAQEALSQFLGIGATGAGLPVSDLGFLTSNQNTGQIAGNTKTSNTNEQKIIEIETKIKTLEKQACTYTKIIKRITLAMEEKEFVLDPNARAANAQFIYGHKLQVVALFNQSAAISPAILGAGSDPNQNKQSLTPENQATYLENTRNEAALGFIDTLKNEGTGILHKDAIVQALTKQNNDAKDPTSGLKPIGNWTEEKSRELAQAGPDKFSFDDLTLDTLNSPGMTYLRAEAQYQKAQSAAIENAKDERGYGSGALPATECVEKSADGKVCKKYKILQLGSVARDYLVAVLTSLLHQMEAGDEVGSDNIKGALAPQGEEVFGTNNEQQPTRSIFDQSNPCPVPEGCRQTGWEQTRTNRPQPAQSNTSNILNSFGDRLAQGIGNAFGNSLDFGTSGLRSLISETQSRTSCTMGPFVLGQTLEDIVRRNINPNPDTNAEQFQAIINEIVTRLIAIIGQSCGR